MNNYPNKAPTVLCIDDDRSILNALSRLLKRNGFSVLCACGGLEGLHVLEREVVDVLVCDAQMPDVGGIQVLKEAATVAPGAARILLTAHCDDRRYVLPAVNEVSIFRLLPKPWDEHVLLSAVIEASGYDPRHWLAAHSAASALDSTAPNESGLGDLLDF